ncbi:MAG: ETX/MTX2 family pore-forming toxin [Methylococcaceae bacterium]|nr:ETX/MTX2 family pore-forming toxin [Methylococcaceae bacterium]
MSTIDIKAELRKEYAADLPNIWNRIKAYYASIDQSLDGLVLDPEGNVDFYADYQIALADFSYQTQTPMLTPVIAFDQTLTNHSNVQDSSTVSFTRSETASFSFGFKEGLKIGTKAKVKVGIPLIADGEAEVSGELTFDANQQWTTSNTQSWSASETVNIPPNSTLRVQGIIQNAKTKATFSGFARVTDGNVLVWFKYTDPTKGYTEFPIPVTVLLTKDQRSFPVSGSYDGIEGVSTNWVVNPV